MSIKTLEARKYVIYEKEISLNLIAKIRHLLHKDLFDNGISKREIDWWKNAACWFPHLRDNPLIVELRDSLPEWARQGIPCEPQILFGLPDSKGYDPHPHIDTEPPWANGKKYRTIVGVPLTKFNYANGGIRFWLGGKENGGVETPNFNPGDLFIMHPDLPHSGGPNLSGGVREAIYFRFLKDEV
jgi:hypothetical protein